jgi:hypothetical protein
MEQIKNNLVLRETQSDLFTLMIQQGKEMAGEPLVEGVPTSCHTKQHSMGTQ